VSVPSQTTNSFTCATWERETFAFYVIKRMTRMMRLLSSAHPMAQQLIRLMAVTKLLVYDDADSIQERNAYRDGNLPA